MKKQIPLGALLCTILLSAFISCQKTEPEPARALYAMSDGYFVKDSLKWVEIIPDGSSWKSKVFTQYESDHSYYYLRRDSLSIRLPKHIDGKFAVQEGNLEWKETGSPIGIYHDCLNTYQWPDVYCYEGGYLAEIDTRYWYRCRQEGDRSVIDTLRVDSVGNNFYLLQGNTESLKVMQINAGIFTDNDTLIYNGQPGEWKPAGRVLVAYGKQKLTSQEKVLLQLFESLFSGDE